MGEVPLYLFAEEAVFRQDLQGYLAHKKTPTLPSEVQGYCAHKKTPTLLTIVGL